MAIEVTVRHMDASGIQTYAREKAEELSDMFPRIETYTLFWMCRSIAKRPRWLYRQRITFVLRQVTTLIKCPWLLIRLLRVWKNS